MVDIRTAATGRGESAWLCALTPAPERPVPVPHCTPELLARATAATGPEPVGWALQVGAVAAEKIFDVIPYFGSTSEMRDLLYAATESITLGALVLLNGPDQVPPPLTEEAKQAVSHYAEHDVPVERILRGIRFGHAEMASAFLAACEKLSDRGERQTAALRAVSARLFDHVDRYGEECAQHYRMVRDAWVTSSAAVLRRAVESVLAGEDDRADLSYDLRQVHRAVVVSRTAPTGVGVEQAACDVLRRLGATTQLVVPVSTTTAWAWAGSCRGAAANPGAPEGFHVAVGPDARAVTGFRESHRAALSVQLLLDLRGRRTDVLLFDDVELVVLMTHDLPAACRFVRRVLGPLAEPNQRNADILGTLAAYLDLGGSPSAVAERHNLARNTVSARIQRASTLLRRDVALDNADLHAALMLVGLLGDAVLVAGTDPVATPLRSG